MKITGILYALFGLSLCITLQTACSGEASPEALPSTKPKTLAAATKLINDECPKMVDPESRLDSVLLSQEGLLSYYYTLPNKDNPAINPTSFTAFLLPGIIDNIRSNPDLKMHRDSSITMVFNYRSRSGEFITEFSVGPQMYR